jgi:hypothetical protein
VLWVDEIERRAVAALSAGAEVDPDEERLKFDTALNEKPESVADPERYELMQALGLRG